MTQPPMNNPSQTKDMNELNNKIEEILDQLLFDLTTKKPGVAKTAHSQLEALIEQEVAEQVRLGSSMDGRDASPRNPEEILDIFIKDMKGYDYQIEHNCDHYAWGMVDASDIVADCLEESKKYTLKQLVANFIGEK